MQIAYTDDQGRERFEIVPAVDISPEGCRVVLQYRCPVRTVVKVQVTHTLFGSASVRYQRATPRGYATGLEFLGGMRIPVEEPAG